MRDKIGREDRSNNPYSNPIRLRSKNAEIEQIADAKDKELAMIVMEFVSKGSYDAWYESNSSELEGFVGVAGYLAMAYKTFDRAVHSYVKDCSEDEAYNFDWIEAMERFIENLSLGKVLSCGEVEDLADFSLRNDCSPDWKY